MWSGPRNISTALMRSFGNRPDTYISDEPFYAYYLHRTNENHPAKEKIISTGQTNWNLVVQKLVGDIPNNKNIWYQKHMAHHNFPENNLDWIKEMENIILIRNPKDVIFSYIKKYKLKNSFQLGYTQQMQLYNILQDYNKCEPIIIDSEDLLENPKKILKKLCKKCNIPFYSKMLSWPKGTRETDGVWGEYWYKKVQNTTHFLPPIENNKSIPVKYEKIFLDCMQYYKKLYKQRMR